MTNVGIESTEIINEYKDSDLPGRNVMKAVVAAELEKLSKAWNGMMDIDEEQEKENDAGGKAERNDG